MNRKKIEKKKELRRRIILAGYIGKFIIVIDINASRVNF